ncbi:MAG: sugar phosphate nucleotidyltransferase [Acidobacteriota bacterium]
MSGSRYALIMAGGQGTRFWPYSTEEKPKQFLDIIGGSSLIGQTYDRLKVFIPTENIFIIADRKYLDLTLESIPELKESNYIVEPSPKNTAPCLILANIVLSKMDPDGTLLVVPADHYIPEKEKFALEMQNAMAAAGERAIVTSGVKPYLPHTGYGYIKFNSNSSSDTGGTEFFRVEEFREKPSFEIAEKYVKAGNYYWNSGMFIYKLKYFKEFLEEYAPDYHNFYLELEKNIDDEDSFRKTFSDVVPESIDYVLMEKVKEVKMFGAGFTWNDVGAWLSVYELNDKDLSNNVNLEENIIIDSENSLIFSTEDKPVAVIGLDNVAVINTENGILVSNMDKLQNVKDVVKELKNRKN